MAKKRAHSPSPASPLPIFTSSPILDRSSKFIALYSPTLSVNNLRDQYDITSATHRIAAWRKPSTQRAISSQARLLDTGHDDDGEKYGGKAAASVLTSMDVEGVVVVARWYGGVLLGPVRFDHIKNCAIEAIQNWKDEEERASKRIKVQEDKMRRAELVRILPERDQSITVLRDLLAEKKKKSSGESQEKRSPAKVPEYTTLPLAALEKLEQVRDASLGWILNEIEQAEAVHDDEINIAEHHQRPREANVDTGLEHDSSLGSSSSK